MTGGQGGSSVKIRDGHVSNSSSSSFIVAFPRKPKSAKDVLEFMFNGKEGGVGCDYIDDGLSYRQVAERVWNDISLKNAANGTPAQIIEEMSGRYHYSSNRGGGGTFWMNGHVEEDGGSWPQDRNRYFGYDEKLLNEFKQHVIDSEDEDKKLQEEEHKILRKLKAPTAKYAYEGGKDVFTKQQLTKAEIKAHEAYQEALKQFRETNPEYLAWQKKQRAFWDKKWKKDQALRDKIAKVDAQNFLDDNKGKFIFIVSYADDGGEAVMEHGRIFRNVPHVVVNHH